MQREDPRRDWLFLDDIVEAADADASYLSRRTKDEFVGNDLLHSTVLYRLVTSGEASARLSAAFKDAHLEIPWRRIVGFRNIAVHHYFGVELSQAWTAATESAPKLHEQVAAILAAESPEEGP